MYSGSESSRRSYSSRQWNMKQAWGMAAALLLQLNSNQRTDKGPAKMVVCACPAQHFACHSYGLLC